MGVDESLTIYSHLPILRDLIREHNVRRVLEFGLGDGSTNVFREMCDFIVSIEMKNQEWFDKYAALECAWFKPICAIGDPQAGVIKAMEFGTGSFDMVLVDGCGESRPEQIMVGTMLAPLVVAHDTEQESFNWSRFPIPDGWETTHYGDVPRTSVYRCAR
jgi:hypothetical protein